VKIQASASLLTRAQLRQLISNKIIL